VSPISEVSEFAVDALLCDSAITAEGKLYVQGGGWTMLTVQAMPAQLPRLGVGAVVTVPYAATNRNHTLTIELKSEDGAPVLVGVPPALGDPTSTPDQQPVKAEAQFNIGRPPMLVPGEAQAIAFAVNMDGIQITSVGGFVVDISIDGTSLRTLTFRVQAVQQALGIR
jgi:uncharacterized protein DUF6941